VRVQENFELGSEGARDKGCERNISSARDRDRDRNTERNSVKY